MPKWGTPSHITTAQPGTLYCRLSPEGTLTWRPIASWAYLDGKQVPMLYGPEDAGPRLPTDDDVAAFVGICPPDKEPLLWFAPERLHDARRRYFKHLQPEMDVAHSAGWSVEAPGLGRIDVKYAGPPGQRPGADREPSEGMGPAHVRRANRASVTAVKPTRKLLPRAKREPIDT